MSKSTSHSFSHKSSDVTISSADVNQRQLNTMYEDENNRNQHQPQPQRQPQQQQQQPSAFSARVALKRRRLASTAAVDETRSGPEAFVDSPVASPVNECSDYSAPSPAASDDRTDRGGDSFASPVPRSPSSPPRISHSLLHQAISQGDLTLLDSLLQTLASSSLTGIQSCVNGFNSDGQTLLTHACLVGNAKMVKLLVNSGANIRQTNRDGWTPAHIASFKGSFDIMMFLMNCGRRRPNYGHLACTPPSRGGGGGEGGSREACRLNFSRPESPVDSKVANASSSSSRLPSPSSPPSIVDADPDAPFSAPATPMSSPPTPYSESQTFTPVKKRRRSSSSANDSVDSSSLDDSYLPFSPASPAPSPASPLASNYESTCFPESKNFSSASSSHQQQQQQRHFTHQNHRQQCLTRIIPTSTHQQKHHDVPPPSPLPQNHRIHHHHHPLKSLDPVVDSRIPFSSSSSSTKTCRVDGDAESASASASQSAISSRGFVCTCDRAPHVDSCRSFPDSRAIAKMTSMSTTPSTSLQTFPWLKQENHQYSDCPSPPASPVAQFEHY